MEWTKKQYNQQYEKWVPWLEDKYLAWFGENKTSYVAKDKMKSTKITGNKDVDAAQDDVAEGVGGQFGKGGLGEVAGDAAGKQVFTRSERGGKGEQGGIQ